MLPGLPATRGSAVYFLTGGRRNLMGASINQINLSPDLHSSQYRESPLDLPSTSQLLASGGDSRIDLARGQNKYGCPPFPEPNVLAYGSSTASTITSESFAAAESLRLRLVRTARTKTAAATYARELSRIREEFLNLCELSDLPGVDVIFAASGTDTHLIAAQLANDATSPGLLVVMTDPAETGSGVPAALAGRHFDSHTALGNTVDAGTAFFGGGGIEIATVANRTPDGSPRAAAIIDAEVQALVVEAALAKRRVLLHLVDVSKTGMITPSLNCALGLRARFPDFVEVLVDACQFRLALRTLRAYLQSGFWVALTGSKFVGGPAFSGALLLPDADELRTHVLPPALRSYSARGDWPMGWTARYALADVANFGLLLRWEAALVELRRFRLLPEPAIRAFLETFASSVRRKLSAESTFQPLPAQEIDRRPLVNQSSWDHTPTIFPFILRRFDSGRAGMPLTREETARVYALLRNGEVKLGQPVQCGEFKGTPISALRLCASMPLVVDAVSETGRGPETVIREALLALDKTAALTRAIDHLVPA